ncbi:MAG: STAS domain-containing protein [Pirellulaceae bacterium]|nr:STAS domain-containing protein [Pirellulaceae bacterium]
MNLTVTRQKDYFLAQTEGPIDDTSRDPIREHLHPLVAEPGTKVIVDLSRSPRINSIGVGNLVTLVAHANTNGSRVVFCAIPSFVAVVLSVTKLDKFFEVAPTVADAAAKLGINASA